MSTHYIAQPKRPRFSTWEGETGLSQVERADKFVIAVLKEFYGFLRSNGLETPLEIPDRYRNPNPLKFFKAYSDDEIVLTHYMINEGLLNVVIKEKNPLLIKGSITQKGLEYLFLEQLKNI